MSPTVRMEKQTSCPRWRVLSSHLCTMGAMYGQCLVVTGQLVLKCLISKIAKSRNKKQKVSGDCSSRGGGFGDGGVCQRKSIRNTTENTKNIKKQKKIKINTNKYEKKREENKADTFCRSF